MVHFSPRLTPWANLCRHTVADGLLRTHSKISLAHPRRAGKPVVFSAVARVFFAELISRIGRGGRAPLEAMNDDMERTVDTMRARGGYACALNEPGGATRKSCSAAFT